MGTVKYLLCRGFMLLSSYISPIAITVQLLFVVTWFVDVGNDHGEPRLALVTVLLSLAERIIKFIDKKVIKSI